MEDLEVCIKKAKEALEQKEDIMAELEDIANDEGNDNTCEHTGST